MVAFVFVLILFNALARCSATSTIVISLVASRENRIIMVDESEHPQPPLTLNKPFTVNIYSKISVDKLLCFNKVNINQIHFSLALKDDKSNANKNDYSLVRDVKATRAMKGIWACKLYYSAQDLDDTIEFELEVEVIEPPASEQDDEQIKNTDAPDTNQNEMSTPIKMNSAEATLKNNAKEVISNTSKTTIIIVVVITVIVIITGIIVCTVCRNKWCRKNQTETVEEALTSPEREHSLTPVYEELKSMDISKRPPLPLPPSEREENKKYIHYDTPYDHRFTRPVVPRKPPHILRRL